jgi:uridine monophosphate synthetase
VRSLAPDLWILAPGIGAQGGDLYQALQAGLRSDGLGLLVPVSRSISQAARPRQAASELREAINERRNSISAKAALASDQPPAAIRQSPILTGELTALADQLLGAGCVRFGSFTLKSGLQSPIYLDLRQLVSYPALLERVARAYLPILRRLTFDRLVALPYAALPIGTAISLKSGWPIIYPRKEAKAYGTRLEIEGAYQPGERVAVLDDLATTGGSKFEAIEKLLAASLQVTDVVVLIDRESGAAQALERSGYHLHAVFGLTQLLDYWELTGGVPEDQIRSVREFLDHGAME